MAIVKIDAWAKKVGATLDQTARAIQIELFTGVIDNTRVDTGRMNGNWQTNVGATTDSQLNRLDRTGNAAINEARSNVRSGVVTYFTNNVPYVEYWEQRDGMVAKNMARIETILRKQAK